MEKSSAFLSYMSEQLSNAPQVTVSQLIENVGKIHNVFLVYVDIIKGFCEVGALSSKRVNEMVLPVSDLTEALLSHGLPAQNLIFLNDHHPADAVEFEVFAPHCIRGTDESEVVESLKKYQQLSGAQTFYKNAINGLFGTNTDGLRFFEWLEQTFDKGTCLFIVVGDCTDLCIYQNAMAIRLFANEKNARTHVVVPQSHVRTYDLSVEQATQIGAFAHDADLMDLMFLYHMKMNGIQVVSTIVNE